MGKAPGIAIEEIHLTLERDELSAPTTEDGEPPSRRALLTGAAALAGAGLAKLAGPDTAAAGHETAVGYDTQTAMHVDVSNTTAGSTRILSNIAGTAAFVANNNHPVGISRPDAILGRTAYTTSNCAGVAGTCEADSGGIGVQGATDADNGTGVYGFAGSVVPSEQSGGGVGVFGRGPNQGVLGRCSAGVGVEGEAVAGTGVRGESTSGAGVSGQSTSGAGVTGQSTSAVGVTGQSTSAVGVQGKAASAAGVQGESTSGAGVEGRGASFGVDGRAQGAGTGVFGSSAAGTGTQGSTETGVALLGVAGPNGVAGRFVGRTVVEGALEVTGATPSALVKSADGRSRRLYAPGSVQPLVEAFGEVKIVRGRATVKLNADFDALVGGKYQVFLTEYGNLGGLYVAKRGAHSFQIRSRRRRANGRVGYRLVARLG
jgi:hypothetical protein